MQMVAAIIRREAVPELDLPYRSRSEPRTTRLTEPWQPAWARCLGAR